MARPRTGRGSMLDALRSKASSWVVKAFLTLLVVSFAIWGIGDILRTPRTGGAVARVGDREITPRQLARAFELELERFAEETGEAIGRDHPLAAVVLQRALERLVTLELVLAWADDLGLAASDEEVRAAIQRDPAFQSNGRYDPERLKLVLRTLGLDERSFIDQVRADIVRTRLVRAMTRPVATSDTLARLLWDHHNEGRSAEVLLIPAESVQVETPDEETLRTYWEENKDRFLRPEYRTVTLALVTADDLLDEIAVDEAELQALYRERQREFTEPERRRVVQLLAPDRAIAEEVRRRLDEGASPEEVATALADRGVKLVDLGPVTRGALPPALAEAVFAAEAGAVVGPIQSPFGWHVARVVAVVPARTAAFEDKRAELERELKAQKAAERLPRLATEVDDELAAGTRLEEAAAKFGIRVLTLTLDRRGRTPEGKAPPVALPPALLEKIFAAGEGEAPIMEEVDGLYVAFRVDRIEPQRPMTFEEARARLATVWTLERRRKAAESLAQSLISRAKQGAGLAELAREVPGVRYVSVPRIARSDDPARYQLPVAVARAIFEQAPETLAETPILTPEGAAVVRVGRRIPAPEPEPENLAGLRDEIRRSWQDEALIQLDAWLRTRYPVEVDNRLLASFLQQDGG